MIIWYNDSDRMNHKSNFYYYIGRNFFYMYDAKAQKKYGEKIKTLGLKVFKEDFPKIEKHYKSKGFLSANSYLKYLLENDIKKVDSPVTIESDEKKVLIEGLVNRLSDEDLEKVIDYVKLLLK